MFFHTIYSVSKLIDVLYFVLIYTQKGLFQWPSSGGEMNCTSEHICSKNSYIIKETIPAENAWNPIIAEGYMYIDCLWVSGSFKGNGYSTDLLNACIEDSKEKGKKGICILSAAKKKPFLADPKFLKYKDFTICDEADNGIQLWYLPFSLDAAKPEFKECAKHPHIEQTGYVLYYTNQCPFNAKYVPVLFEVAREREVPFQATRLETKEEAQNAPTPVTTYALFYNGEYVTNEQMNDKRFIKLLDGMEK